MRFVHTADWQMGMKAARVGEAGARVREARLESAVALIETAAEKGAEFLLVAGDTFEDNGVDRVLVQKVSDILGSFPGPVYVIPGNHDPLVPGSVWEHPSWDSRANISILKSAEALEIPGGALYPCPVMEKHSGADPTAWIDTSGAEGIKLGLAHGTVEGIQTEEPDCPVPLDAADRLGLDYLALGHWHSLAEFAGAGGTVRTAYCGTHEPTRFGERDSGQALLVTIEPGGGAPVLERIRTGRLEWLSMEEELSVEGDLERVRREVEQVESPGDKLIRLVLKGLVRLREAGELERLSDLVEARFLYGSIDYSNLRPVPETEQLLEVVPPGVLMDAAKRLLEYTDPACEERPEGVSPEMATQALLELYASAVEVRK